MSKVHNFISKKPKKESMGMVKEKLSIEELEKLSYYDLMGYLDVSFFNFGGMDSTDSLGELCELGQGKRILDVGCGTGTNSIRLAEKFGCHVIGIDISEKMIERAKEKATSSNMTDNVEFMVGDAYHLQFQNDSFDVIITIFVSHLLDLHRAFKEFKRVLKVGGYIGLNELYKEDEIPEDVTEEIQRAENMLQEATQLPFKLNPPNYWKKTFEDIDMNKIKMEKFSIYASFEEIRKIVKEFGGKKIIKIMPQIIGIMLRSKKIRTMMIKANQAKRVLIYNKKSAKYIGYILSTAQKN